jgi:hypothetical protein
MVRIIRLIEVLGMAAETVCAHGLELAADMAGGAIQRGVCASQRESSKLRVIEFRGVPGVHARVAGCAVGREG